MASETAPRSPIAAPLHSTDRLTAPLSTLTYRSRAVAPMSELELHRLVRVAQRRNRAEAVTGMMVYDAGWIFQQLEGPSAGLARIWASIRADTRHTAIEVLSDAPTETRHFGDWHLKLATHGASAGEPADGLSDTPPALISRLYRGERPTDMLVSAWLPSAHEPASLTTAAQALLVSRAALSDLIATVIIPRLCAALPLSDGSPPSRAAMLLSMLTAPDATAAFDLVRAALSADVSLDTLALDLLEPAARGLGDLWQTDDCSEIDVTFGLIRLQAIAREMGAGVPRLTMQRPPVVLVTPQPGEAHMLGAALDAEALWHAGWSPRVDFPASSAALDGMVATTWIDALDLSLSTSFRREHQFVNVAKTIASARLASLNPGLVVVVSGRFFGDVGGPSDTVHRFGADATFGSASQAESTILRVLQSAVGHPREN